MRFVQRTNYCILCFLNTFLSALVKLLYHTCAEPWGAMDSSEKWTCRQFVPKPKSEIISEEIPMSTYGRESAAQEPDLQQPGVAEPVSEDNVADAGVEKNSVDQADVEDNPVEEYKRILKAVRVHQR